ncbi:hypothetical protein SUGI_0282320 [Cryptomeria japonica]|uniref:uncharacterized protein LOC131078621 n=1 Tax=Cryptomeria japonica TaxID=3369 RepID=UPI002408D27D|nr:uncharacterized protein LOC131078621 [Cryptomeria japonica]GLJ16524.1 hypothetical protein SUGI_0282320 [Cryptomeria japonica]
MRGTKMKREKGGGGGPPAAAENPKISAGKGKSRSSRWDKEQPKESKPNSSKLQPSADPEEAKVAVEPQDTTPQPAERTQAGPSTSSQNPQAAGDANSPAQWKAPQAPPQIGFEVLEKRSIIMSDGTSRSYYAVPSDPSHPSPSFAGNNASTPYFDNANFGMRDSIPGPYPGQEINNPYNRPENLQREAEIERFYAANPTRPGGPVYEASAFNGPNNPFGANSESFPREAQPVEGSVPRDRDSQYFEAGRDRDFFRPEGPGREEHLYRNSGPAASGNDMEYMRHMREMEAQDYYSKEQERARFSRMEDDSMRQKMPAIARSYDSPHGASASGVLPHDREQWISPSRMAGPSGFTNRGRQDLQYNNSPLTRKREEDHDYHRPSKYQKHNDGYDRAPLDGRPHNSDVQFGSEPMHALGAADISEDFKQNIQKAFLRLSKVLYENPEHCHKYEEDGKAGQVRCVVCGWQSNFFIDTHSLVMHAYNAENPALRTDHLGLHKALCVMMGWSYALPPDSAKSYQSLTSPEAAANKEDLMLWPPLVIINNAYSGKKRDSIGNREMEEKLKELGFSGGKPKALYGKDGHYRGTVVVKFSPSSSGVREADRLVKYFEVNKHGRKDWLRVQASTTNQGNDDKNPDLVQIDEKTKMEKRVFYGYFAIAGDLEKLDFDMRKKAIIKSRREIDATADGVC